MRKKKGMAFLGAMLAALLLFSGTGMGARAEQPERPLSILTTVFPAYDFAREIAGDRAQVRLLLPPGSEAHSYEPTPQDIIAIQSADLFVFNGGESEHWVREILSALGEGAPRALAMMDSVTVLAQEQSQSMQAEEHAHSEEGPEWDEHVWTSPKNAKLIVQALTQTLAEIDEAGAETYKVRESEYIEQLDKLDGDFAEVVTQGARQKIIFGDRFPFRYFAHAYGLAYDAAFPGCSEDSEPSAQTVISLIREIQRDRIPVVFYIEFSNQKTAGILAEETGAKPLLMHSCHNISAEELAKGVSYLALMERNVDALREALN